MRLFLWFFVPFHIFVFRLTGGRLLGQFELPVLLLTTKGRRSGKQRTVALLYLEDDGALLVIASLGGAPTNPDWYHNLVANPNVSIMGGPEQMVADPEEILHDAVDRREALELPRGLEAAHLPFALSRRFVRDLGSVVGVPVRAMDDRGITVRQAAP